MDEEDDKLHIDASSKSWRSETKTRLRTHVRQGEMAILDDPVSRSLKREEKERPQVSIRAHEREGDGRKREREREKSRLTRSETGSRRSSCTEDRIPSWRFEGCCSR